MKNKIHQISESESDPDNPSEGIENSDIDESDNSRHHENADEDNSKSPSIQSQNTLNSNSVKCEDILSQSGKNLPKEINSGFSEKLLNKKTSSPKATFYIEEITEDDEIYTFQCPKDFNIQDLLNKPIDFSNRHKLSVKNEVLHLDVLETDKKFLTLAIPKKTSSGCLINIPLKGHMIIQRGVKVSQYEDIDIKDCDDRIEFPKDIKVRHPLLGCDWNSQIELAEKAIQRQHILRKKLRKEKKEKNKRKEKIENESKKRESSSEEISLKTKKRKQK